MSFEAPFDDLSISAPVRAVVLIVLEEAIEHVHVPEVAERFGRCAELDVIVRRRRRGCQQTILNLAHESGNFGAARAVKGFENRGFIAGNAAEIRWTELVQQFIISDNDTKSNAAVA